MIIQVHRIMVLKNGNRQIKIQVSINTHNQTQMQIATTKKS